MGKHLLNIRLFSKENASAGIVGEPYTHAYLLICRSCNACRYAFKRPAVCLYRTRG